MTLTLNKRTRHEYFISCFSTQDQSFSRSNQQSLCARAFTCFLLFIEQGVVPACSCQCRWAKSPMVGRKRNSAAAWGKGKAEIMSLGPEIIKLSGQGNNAREIHERLSSDGKTTTAYRTFARHTNELLSKAQNPDPQKVVPLNPQAPATPAKKRKKTLPSNHEPPKFEYNRNVDLDYLLSPADGSKPKEESEQ